MEQAIREQYNDKVFQELIGKYGIEPSKIRPLGGFESFVFEFEREQKEYILRISHTGLRRTKEQVYGEVDFINYLADHEVPVARVVPSPKGNLLEAAENENPLFVAVSFEKAKGGAPKRHHWVPAFIESYGQIMGRIHRVTRNYQPSNPSHKRPEGQEDLIGFAEKFLPSSEKEIIEKWNQSLAHLETLSKGKGEYGLIHQDMHGGNFFVDDQGRLTFFDFDDSQYFWFAHDIAMALFYIVPHHCIEKEDVEKAREFLKHFMIGYRRENDLQGHWMKEIPTFLALREMDLYIAIHRSEDLNHLDSWCTSFMRQRKEKILNNIPYVDLDFSAFI